MAGFDLGGVLGAVLGGGQPVRRTRRRAPPRGQDLGRALAMLAGVAIEAMAKSQQQQQPAPPPPPRRAPGAGDAWGAPPPAKPAPARPARGSVPTAGRDPWGGAGAAKPAPAAGWDPVPGVPAPPPISAEDREGLLMLRAMIAAAKADGHVDSAERERIADQLDAAGLGPAARDQVLAEFDRAATPEDLAREARDPMLAAQVYAAAVAGAAAIEGAERAWLDGFAKALKLDRAATEAIERRIRGG
jgi:uncharacterized membrane protein YebE (DUF533 family)